MKLYIYNKQKCHIFLMKLLVIIYTLEGISSNHIYPSDTNDYVYDIIFIKTKKSNKHKHTTK